MQKEEEELEQSKLANEKYRVLGKKKLLIKADKVTLAQKTTNTNIFRKGRHLIQQITSWRKARVSG